MATMRSVMIRGYGGPDVLEIQEAPIPTPGAGEVLVRMAHAGLNVMDIKTRKGDYDGSRAYPVTLPTGLGMEGGGIVEQIGNRVEDFQPGDRVAYCLVWNSHAEFAVVPADRLVKVPDAISLRVAGTSTFQGLTAHYLLRDVAALPPGSQCLVHAASGGVGQMLIALAARLEITVYGTVRREEEIEAGRTRGATDVFLSTKGAFVERVLERTDGRGVDAVFDSIGQPTLRDDLKILRKRGMLVNYGNSAGAVQDLDPAELGEAGSIFLTRPRLQDYVGTGKALRDRADDLYRHMIDGSFSVKTGRHYRIDQIRQAHIDMEAKQTDGKSIIDLLRV